MNLIFVYGTLKRGGSNHPFLAGQAFVGEATTGGGLALFDLGNFPGMVESPGSPGGITGEIWSVDAACLARLDALEGTAEGEYRRAPVELLPPFSGLGVETYLYLRDVAGRPLLGTAWTG